ncbi:MAG TPA: hypothetical protein VGJ03_00150 [Acidimicrobiales bacterium]|jgi:hypothetical protein
MFIIGIVLLAAALTVGIDIAVQNSQQVNLEAFSQVWTSSPSAAFVVGVITALVGVLGVFMMVDGFGRSRARRRERRAIVEERDRLAAERQSEIDAMNAHNDRRDLEHDHDRETVDLRDREPVAARTDDRGDRVEHRDVDGILHRSDI